MRAALFVPVALFALFALIPLVLMTLLATAFLKIGALFVLVALTEGVVGTATPVTVTL
jgi:hypothetical protein